MTVSDWVLRYCELAGDFQTAARVKAEQAWREAFRAGDPNAWRLELVAFGGDAKAVPNDV